MVQLCRVWETCNRPTTLLRTIYTRMTFPLTTYQNRVQFNSFLKYSCAFKKVTFACVFDDLPSTATSSFRHFGARNLYFLLPLLNGNLSQNTLSYRFRLRLSQRFITCFKIQLFFLREPVSLICLFRVFRRNGIKIPLLCSNSLYFRVF